MYIILMTLATYDDSGYNDYTDIVNNAIDNVDQATVLAGMSPLIIFRSSADRRELGQRLEEGEVDLSLRSAYGLMGVSPKTPQEDASDYYQIDFVSKSCLVC